ncbi:hypothetical protein BDR26DRAFT_861247 [Obelidium mucronatum]|nr:hypothetical protein BDR26DRAFT_861247 [Obelidium mucronatum]
MWRKVVPKSHRHIQSLLFEVFPQNTPFDLLYKIASYLPETVCRLCKKFHGSHDGHYTCRKCGFACNHPAAVNRISNLCEECNVEENWSQEELYEYYEMLESQWCCPNKCKWMYRSRKGIERIVRIDACSICYNSEYFRWRSDDLFNGGHGDEFYDRKEALGKKRLKKYTKINKQIAF